MSKYANVNDVAIYDDHVRDHLKLMQKVASKGNLRSNKKGILMLISNQKRLKNKLGIHLTTTHKYSISRDIIISFQNQG